MVSMETSVLQRIATESPISSFYLSLKDVAFRKVAVILCSSANVLTFVAGTNVWSEDNTPEEIESKSECAAKKALSALSLPGPAKKELLCLMKPLFRELTKWIHFHENFCGNSTLHYVNILKHVCWTPLGTVDYRKTAEELICHEKLDIDERYKLACLYCLPEHVRAIWSKLPKSCVGKELFEMKEARTNFYNEVSALRVHQPDIVVFWTYTIEGQAHLLNERYHDVTNFSINQHSFESVAVCGLKTATEYFFGLLTSEEKEVSLVKTARDVAERRTYDSCSYRQEYQKFSDVLFFLLSVMSEDQRMEVLKSHPCEILKCCLDWPRQGIFVEVAQLAFPYLKKEDYCRLLFILSRNMKWGYNYADIYRKFFLASPREFRDFSLRVYAHFVKELFAAGNVEAVKFIFKNLDAEEKATLILSKASFGCFADLMCRQKWDWLELYIREAKLSQRDKDKLVMEFAAHDFATLSKQKRQTFVDVVHRINATSYKCDKATLIDFPSTTDFPDIDREELPSKKHKKF